VTAPAKLLSDLLSYIVEQAKEINPEEFRLAGSTLFKKEQSQLTGMPGVRLDVQGQGDHLWLVVDRMAEIPPPVAFLATEPLARLVTVADDPDRPPGLNPEALQAAVAAEGRVPE